MIMAAMTLFGCGKKSDNLTLLVGTYTDTDSKGMLDNFIKISDSRMYEMKMTKPNRRK